MKTIPSLALLTFCFLLVTAVNVTAAENSKYVGSLSGVECTACKRTIAKALSKLEGVKTVRIVKQGENNHRLEVLTDGSKSLTKSDASKALEKAKHYKILSWKKS